MERRVNKAAAILVLSFQFPAGVLIFENPVKIKNLIGLAIVSGQSNNSSIWVIKPETISIYPNRKSKADNYRSAIRN